MNWLKLNTKEIKDCQSLYYFAIFISLLHLYNAFLWSSSLSNEAFPSQFCWGIWPQCQNLFSITSSLVTIKIYGAFALVTTLLLFYKKTFKAALILLAITFSLKTFIYLTQYSLKTNTHAFLFILEICFLLIPQKIRCIKWLTVAYFTVIGLFKLNSIWLSGYSLIPYFSNTPIKALEWLAVFIFLIEIFAPLGLLSTSIQVFATSFLALSAYSLLTFFWIDHFQPLVYMGLLLFFPASKKEQRKYERQYIYNNHSRKEPNILWAWLIVFSFLGFQFFSYIYSSKSSSPTEFILRLEPDSTPTECRQEYFVQLNNSSLSVPARKQISSAQKPYCYKAYAINSAQKLCQKYSDSYQKLQIWTQFYQRGLLQKKLQPVFFKQDACSDSPSEKLDL